jgi:hypothetical protein
MAEKRVDVGTSTVGVRGREVRDGGLTGGVHGAVRGDVRVRENKWRQQIEPTGSEREGERGREERVCADTGGRW